MMLFLAMGFQAFLRRLDYIRLCPNTGCWALTPVLLQCGSVSVTAEGLVAGPSLQSRDRGVCAPEQVACYQQWLWPGLGMHVRRCTHDMLRTHGHGLCVRFVPGDSNVDIGLHYY